MFQFINFRAGYILSINFNNSLKIDLDYYSKKKTPI